jgi:hypothetical protein
MASISSYGPTDGTRSTTHKTTGNRISEFGLAFAVAAIFLLAGLLLGFGSGPAFFFGSTAGIVIVAILTTRD